MFSTRKTPHWPHIAYNLLEAGVAAVTAVVVAVAPVVAAVAVTPVVVVEAAEAAEAADALEAAPGVEAAVSGGGAEAVVCRGVPVPCASGMNQTVGALASTREHRLTAISLVISSGCGAPTVLQAVSSPPTRR
jgi:hypothetical protein